MLSPGCGGGAKSKGALYRETLQTTGFYMGRIVIVTREFTPIPSPPLRCLRFRESSRNAFGEACGIYRSDGDQTNSQTVRRTASRWSAPRLGWPHREFTMR